MEKKSYAIALVIYNPSFCTLKRIEMMTCAGYSVYVFDNSFDVSGFKDSVLQNKNVHYFASGSNLGLGTPLTIICATASARGEKGILFLDQDTSVSVATLDFIEKFRNSLSDDEYRAFASLTFTNGKPNNLKITEKKLVINSGSLFSLEALQEIGWHNKDFFVDCVDYEFCLRARRSGFKIGVVSDTPDFDHVSEQPDLVFAFLNSKIAVRRYSVSRIRDAVGAYSKLIVGCLVRFELGNVIVLFRSLMIYIFAQLIARTIEVSR